MSSRSRTRDRVVDAAQTAFVSTGPRGLLGTAAVSAGMSRALVHKLIGDSGALAAAVVARAAARQRAAPPGGPVVADPPSARCALAVLLRADEGPATHAAFAWEVAVRRTAREAAPDDPLGAEAAAIGRVLLGHD